MRLDYLSRYVPFPPDRVNTRKQTPKQIVVHRQGNPGVEGQSGIKWMARTGLASIHYYIDDDIVYSGVPTDRHAFHVLEPRKVTGRITYGPHGRRGDYDTIGIECEDESPASADLAPGQKYGLSQDTRVSLVVLLATLMWQSDGRLTPADIVFHSTLDPWTRPEDLGDALNLDDLRLDVKDLLDSRTPYRTVGRHARGERRPVTVPAPKPAAPTPPVRVAPMAPGLTAANRDDVFGRLYQYARSQGAAGDRVSMSIESDRVVFTVLR